MLLDCSNAAALVLQCYCIAAAVLLQCCGWLLFSAIPSFSCAMLVFLRNNSSQPASQPAGFLCFLIVVYCFVLNFIDFHRFFNQTIPHGGGANPDGHTICGRAANPRPAPIYRKKYAGAFGHQTVRDFHPLPRTAFPLRFGPLFGLDPVARSLSRSGLAHF